MIWRPPRYTLTYMLFPSTVLCRSGGLWQRVTWRLRPDGLWRYSGVPAARYPLPEPAEGVLLMPDATGLPVRAWVPGRGWRDPLQISEEHTSELPSLMRISYAVFCLNKKKIYIFTYLVVPHD